MKTIKNVFATLSIVLLMTSVNDLFATNNPSDWKSKLVTYLNDFDELNDIDVPEKIYVDFILNPKGEIMILSTSHPKLDDWLKAKLNYRKVGVHDLESMEKYTLPIVFNKK